MHVCTYFGCADLLVANVPSVVGQRKYFGGLVDGRELTATVDGPGKTTIGSGGQDLPEGKQAVPEDGWLKPELRDDLAAYV